MNLVDLNPLPATAEMIVAYYNVTLDALRKRHLTSRLKRFESIKDRQRQFAEAKDELSIEAGFMMLAYVESLFRMDFVARLENRKWKDPLSAHFRGAHKSSQPLYRYSLDDIFMGWRRESGACDYKIENILRRLPQYFDYRNWVAHGRYWIYKEKDYRERFQRYKQEWELGIINDAESENCAEHRCHIRQIAVCAGDRLVLRAVDADGAWRGGLRDDMRS